MRELVHFVHGNGFPSPCYNALFGHLSTRFDYCYLDRVGHNPNFPVTENWSHLVQEVIYSIRQQASQPVIGIGHSLGGVLTVLAAMEAPSLFKAVIMLDSPMLGRVKSVLLRLSKAFGVIDQVTPASRTRKRRHHWDTREHAVAYLRRRALFKSFSEGCLQDYIEYGMEKTDSGYVLRFDPQIEYQIYRTIPDTSYLYEGKLNVPTTLIYGDKSHLIQRPEIRYMKQKYGIRCIKTHGTHMFPMEHPDASAKLIMQSIDAMAAEVRTDF